MIVSRALRRVLLLALMLAPGGGYLPHAGRSDCAEIARASVSIATRPRAAVATAAAVAPAVMGRVPRSLCIAARAPLDATAARPPAVRTLYLRHRALLL